MKSKNMIAIEFMLKKLEDKDNARNLGIFLNKLQDRVNADKTGLADDNLKELVSLVKDKYELLKIVVELRNAIKEQNFTLASKHRNTITAMINDMKSKK